jgi:hypothetical protein
MRQYDFSHICCARELIFRCRHELICGDALNRGQLGQAPGRVQVASIGGTYTFSPSIILDATIGYTRQRLGAEALDIDSNFGLDVLKIPGTNGPDRLQGGQPAFQFSGTWATFGFITSTTGTRERNFRLGARLSF